MEGPLVDLAKQTASVYGLDPILVCAVIEQESDWEPWSIRYEDAFYNHYVDPSGVQRSSTEYRARAFSWGLMQIMGEVARELGFTGHLASLCDPATGINWGCRKLQQCLKSTTSVHDALQRWNGGGDPNYANEVIARMKNYTGPTVVLTDDEGGTA
jgi:soluble lytic murein transglycosylase-like protein